MEQLTLIEAPRPQEQEASIVLNGLHFVLERLRGGAWGQLAEQVKE